MLSFIVELLQSLFLTHYDLFCTVDPESYLETSCTSVFITAMQVEKKEKKERYPCWKQT